MDPLYGIWKEEDADLARITTEIEKNLSELFSIWENAERIFGTPYYEIFPIEHLLIIRKLSSPKTKLKIPGVGAQIELGFYCVQQDDLIPLSFGGVAAKGCPGEIQRSLFGKHLEFQDCDREGKSGFVGGKDLVMVFPTADKRRAISDDHEKQIRRIRSQFLSNPDRASSLKGCLDTAESRPAAAPKVEYFRDLVETHDFTSKMCRIHRMEHYGPVVIDSCEGFLPDFNSIETLVMFCVVGNEYTSIIEPVYNTFFIHSECELYFPFSKLILLRSGSDISLKDREELVTGVLSCVPEYTPRDETAAPVRITRYIKMTKMEKAGE